MSKHSTPSVNLFPFLAVLVCTMGALILLLLVTTRRIRQQATIQPTVEVVEAVEPTAESVLLELPQIATPDPADEPLSPWLAFDPKPQPEPDPQVDWEAERQQRRAQYEAELAQRQAAKQRINEQWSQKLAEAMKQVRELESQLEERREHIQVTQQSADAAKAEVDSLTNQLANAMTEKARILNQIEQVREKQQLTETEFAQLREQFESIETRANEKEVEFEIIGFNGNSKTRRRPILIECKAKGITFAVENITLTPNQLSGFTAAHNPLRAGAEALAEYWTRVEDLDSSNTKPYILLLVRPGGTVGYYIARQMLGKMDQEFGYELIPHQNPLKWAEPDPQAVALCQTAVDAVLNERERLASRLRTGRLPIAGSLMFAGADGNFHLQEVDELRDAGDSFGTGQEKWQSPTARRRAQQLGTGDSERLFGSVASPPGTNGLEDEFGVHDNAAIGGTAAGESDRARPLPQLQKLPSFQEIVERQKLLGEQADSLSGFPAEEPVGESNLHPRSKLQPANPQEFAEAGNAPQTNSGQSTATVKLPDSLNTTDQSGQSGQASSATQQFAMGQQSLQGTAQGRAGQPPAGQPLEEWMPKSSQASIGIEREIVIHVRKDSLQIDNLPKIPIAHETTPEALRETFARNLLRHLESWDAAPNSFFWRPYLKYEVHPGGNLPYARLKPISDDWKAKTKTEYVLEE